MHANRLVMLLLVLVLAVAGCQETKKVLLSWGHPQVIYVFAADDVWEAAHIDLERMLAREFYTTQNERWFRLERADIENFEASFRFDNLLFLGSLDSDDATTKFMLDLLGPDVADQVKKSGTGIYSKTDHWAQGQIAVFFLADTRQNITQFNMRQSEKLFEVFKQQFYARIKQHIYLYEPRPESFFAAWPWTLQLPNNYQVYKEDRDDNYICYWLQVGDAPERYLAVWSEQIERPEDLRVWMKQAREYIGTEYYAGEKMLPTQPPRFMKAVFAQHDGWRMNGHWINDETVTGGAFQSWGFYHEPSGRAYLIDTSVFYPEGNKLRPLTELDIIAQTFRLKEDVAP